MDWYPSFIVGIVVGLALAALLVAVAVASLDVLENRTQRKRVDDERRWNDWVDSHGR